MRQTCFWIAAIAAGLCALSSPTAVPAQQPYYPGPELRSAILEACRAGVLRDVQNDARSLVSGAGADVTLDEASATFVQDGKDRVRIEGRGEFRYGLEYLPQPMTFSCEWEISRERLRRGGYRRAKEADITALPPAMAEAAAACARAARADLTAMARRRLYISPSLTIRPGARFEETSGGFTLHGEGTYKLDRVQEGEMVAEYRCEWDAESRAVRRVRTEPRDRWQREIGTLTCESRNRARQSCRAPIRGAVRLRSNHSDTRCAHGTNWSWSTREIVVWDGCRATFEFEMR
jgi:hypothetical protein